MHKPIVKVIGFTKFLGIPTELRPFPSDQEVFDTQDKGSDGARLIECAGRTCYDSYGKGRPSNTYHEHILQVGHGSVLEHTVINFYIDGISRGCSHEWVRHRAGTAISQRSTRYVNESDGPWIWHPLIDKHANPYMKEKLAELQAKARSCYQDVVFQLQKTLEDSGLDKVTARKQARGAARGTLGNALETAMVWSANIRALRNILELRAHPAADAEIRLLANRIYEEANLVCPEYFSDYETHPCEDGIGYYITTNYRKV